MPCFGGGTGNHTEDDKKDEAIVPCDKNVIIDDDLRIILQDLKPGAFPNPIKSTPPWQKILCLLRL